MGGCNSGCCANGYRITGADHRASTNAIDQTGRMWIVTGGTGGIGRETARVLLCCGATVVVTGRERARTERAAAELSAETKGQCIGMACDLTSLKSVREFVAAFNAATGDAKDAVGGTGGGSAGRALNGIICNAGVMAVPYRQTKDGFDEQFGVNHIGHHLLVTLLLDRLTAVAGSRVVCVSSDLAFGGAIDYALLPAPSAAQYNAFKGYAQSKLANILFAKGLAARSGADAALGGGRVRHALYACSVMPGVIATDLGSEMACAGCLRVCKFCIIGCCLKSIPQGAATSVYCAIGKDVTENGAYYRNSRVLFDIPQYATDQKEVTRLWDWTEAALSKALGAPAGGAVSASASAAASAAPADSSSSAKVAPEQMKR